MKKMMIVLSLVTGLQVSAQPKPLAWAREKMRPATPAQLQQRYRQFLQKLDSFQAYVKTKGSCIAAGTCTADVKKYLVSHAKELVAITLTLLGIAAVAGTAAYFARRPGVEIKPGEEKLTWEEAKKRHQWLGAGAFDWQLFTALYNWSNDASVGAVVAMVEGQPKKISPHGLMASIELAESWKQQYPSQAEKIIRKLNEILSKKEESALEPYQEIPLRPTPTPIKRPTQFPSKQPLQPPPPLVTPPMLKPEQVLQKR